MIKDPLPCQNPLFRINCRSQQAVAETRDAILSLARQREYTLERLVILCIGTDRSTGDALGPLTGTWLKKRSMANLMVLGTLEEPIHAVNLEQSIARFSDGSDSNRLVIAVDACLGKQESVGLISIRPGPLRPGAGVSKNLPPVGDISIHGIVNVGGFLEYLVLQSTRLSLVVQMAEIIGTGILEASQNLLGVAAEK